MPCSTLSWLPLLLFLCTLGRTPASLAAVEPPEGSSPADLLYLAEEEHLLIRLADAERSAVLRRVVSVARMRRPEAPTTDFAVALEDTLPCASGTAPESVQASVAASDFRGRSPQPEASVQASDAGMRVTVRLTGLPRVPGELRGGDLPSRFSAAVTWECAADPALVDPGVAFRVARGPSGGDGASKVAVSWQVRPSPDVAAEAITAFVPRHAGGAALEVLAAGGLAREDRPYDVRLWGLPGAEGELRVGLSPPGATLVLPELVRFSAEVLRPLAAQVAAEGEVVRVAGRRRVEVRLDVAVGGR